MVVPHNPDHLPAIWAFCQSADFKAALRRVSPTLYITNNTVAKVPFDLAYWQKVANE